MDKTYQEMVAFHGHSCPGLAMGYRMTKAALDHLAGKRSEDEELVAIVENNACGVDALQYLSGCTFGKGNLIFRDYGKHVYTLYSRNTHKGVRVAFDFGKVPETLLSDRETFAAWLMNTPEKEILTLQDVDIDEPDPARIFQSVPCDFCGEAVMKTRTRSVGEKTACIPCAEARRPTKAT